MLLPLVNLLLLSWVFMRWPMATVWDDFTRYLVFVAVIVNTIIFYQYVVCFYPNWLTRFAWG